MIQEIGKETKVSKKYKGSIYDLEMPVDGNENYVCPVDSDILADELRALDGPGFTIVELRQLGFRLGGLRLQAEVVDKLAKWWIDLRRMCPFCHEPGMDVEIDEYPHGGSVVTRWACEQCGGEYDLNITPDRVPWEDPLEGTR